MIQIDEMVLRVPGIPEEQAASLGQKIAQLVSDQLPYDIGDHTIADLNIKINEVSFSGSRPMAMQIAEQIVREIKLAICR